ncbi:M28 family metallopeptidase [Pedomonas mirosovicensis]|uniref:M28 family metallopeptidase n=1 Tax=Pedomonas mirosovicensis TaxID=2908641 RepID=UPI00216A62E9|nr:M28 family metallopeptidase [Pedomonas mirosovicensis]MCH8685157.1 M28 family metallopeptidase [Pedomonas mirosovicensis]
MFRATGLLTATAILSSTALGLCLTGAGFSAQAATLGQAISPVTIGEHVKTLASDEFEGRAPATKGEELTVRYIADQMAKGGIKPGGEKGGWFQAVPMVESTTAPTPLTITGGKQPITLNYINDQVIWTKRVREQVKLENSDLVFVGYGIDAPEWNWNDYAGLDVKGKTVVVLVNDPGFATQDPKLFNGKTMTYYGRWTYKYEEAARKGAAGVLIIHDTAPAAYPWDVVKTSWTGPQLDIAHDNDGMDRAAVEGWLTNDAAQRLFASAGLDYKALVAAAAKPGFKAVDMGDLKVSATLNNTIRRSASQNVVGIVPGTKRPDEYILYTAHWDHIGRCTADETGDDICNGAVDNATGIAGLIEIGKRFAAAKPERSVVLLAVTGEESGLLGSKFYAANPLYPLPKTVAGFNMDALSTFGRTRDVVVVGTGKSELEPLLKKHAAMQGRVLVPEPKPEAGSYYRSDHFELAKVGVPMLYADSGVDVVGKGPEWGRQQSARYVAHDYHKPSDEVTPDMDFSGTAEDAELLFQTGLDLANSGQWPKWLPSAEFGAAREASLKGASK